MEVGQRVVSKVNIGSVREGWTGILQWINEDKGHVAFNNASGIFSMHISDLASDHEYVSKVSAASAESFLNQAATTMAERGNTYDKPTGERSMGATVAAFNAITDHELTEADGWLLMLLLKQVRQWQKTDYHEDSAVDAVAYSALLAEALASGK